MFVTHLSGRVCDAFVETLGFVSRYQGLRDTLMKVKSIVRLLKQKYKSYSNLKLRSLSLSKRRRWDERPEMRAGSHQDWGGA